MKRRLRARFSLAAVTVLAVTGLVSVGSPDLALGSSGPTYRRSFSATKQHYFSTLKRCVRVSIKGSTTFHVRADTAYTWFYRDRKVIHPALTVQTYPVCATGPMQPRAVYKMSLGQSWMSSTCSSGVSMSVGAPWGVSVGVSPSCHRAKLAARRTSYAGYTWSRTQNNSTTTISVGNENMAPMAWGHQFGGPTSVRAPLCFNVSVDIVVQTNRLGDSDSYTTSLKPCVRYW